MLLPQHYSNNSLSVLQVYILLQFGIFLPWLVRQYLTFVCTALQGLLSPLLIFFSRFSPAPRTNDGIEGSLMMVQGGYGTDISWELSPSTGELQRELLLLPIASTKLCHISHPISLLLFVLLFCPDAFWMLLLTNILYLCLLFSVSHGPNPYVLKAACLKSPLAPVLSQQAARAACLSAEQRMPHKMQMV